jgi:DNA polymerase-3 subunit alpha
VHFRLSTPGLDVDQFRSLRSLLLRHRGSCDVLLHIKIPNRSETTIKLPGNLKVAASDQLMDDTQRLFSYDVVTFE